MATDSLHDAVLAVRFDVIALAGKGGMSTVFRAMHRDTGEIVALKIVDASDEARKRFEREATALKNTTHPCVVRYRDHGELGDGRMFLAMEWIEGELLSARLRSSRLDLREAMTIGAKLARALAPLHASGLVHRDVKPGNVMLRNGDANTPVLLDFGLVKPVVGEEITSVGLAVGTPGYMAPEQARGSARVDARTDVFALACLLFRCVTGHRPFDGTDATAILTKVLFDAAPSMRSFEPRVASDLDALVAKMLAKNVEDRPRDVTEIADTLEQLAMREAPSQSRLADATALTPAEQRPVSVVLVAEVAPDAPTMVASLESSEVLLRPVASPMAHDSLVNLAQSLGGVAETLANGALVVVFDGSTNARDQCMRAARCALRLEAMVPYKTVALASGRARTSGGSIVGEAVDRAVETLRGAAQEGGVKVDAASAHLLESRFEIASGATQRLLRERDEGLIARTLLGTPTPCVGRDMEIGAVLGALEQCVEEKVSRIVAITADAGVGKSRLASEVVADAKAAHPNLSVWLARGDSLFERSALALVGKLLRELAGVSQSGSADERLARMSALVARHVPEDTRSLTAQFLGEICGVPFDDTGRPALRAARSDAQLMAGQLKIAFDTFVAAETAARPLLVIIEDLHWADARSISYFERAVASGSGSALLVLALSRPEGEARFPTLFAQATHLRMRPLAAKAATKLARDVLGPDVPAATIQRVIDLAAGNAFYLEELIRAVSENRADLPETVVLMAQARLQALDPDARRVLRAASVFGEAFTEEDVAALEGGPEVAHWLPTLLEREVLTGTPHTSTFSFRHALLREAAYASLTDDDRVLGHKLAAKRLETRGDRNAMSIADHYARGGEPAAAVASYVRAAEQALDAGELEAPFIAMQRARDCGAASVMLGRLEGMATRAAWLRGDMATAEQLGRDALTRLKPGESSWYEVIADLGNALQGRLDHSGIEELGRLVLEHPPKVISAAYARSISLAYTLVIQNAPDSPLARDLTTAIEHVGATVTDDPLIEARVAVSRAFGAIARRHPSVASLFELAARRMEEVGNAEIARMQRNSQGTALGWLGAWDQAAAVVGAIGAATGRASLWARVTLGWSLAQLGRLDEATRAVEGALAEGGADSFLIVESHFTLARIELLKEKPDVALTRIEKCLEDTSLPLAIQVRLHAVAFEATMQRDPERARVHGHAMEQGFASGVALVEEAIYVRWMVILMRRMSNEHEGAAALLRETRAMIADYAALIDEPALRNSYLTRVRENAEVLKLTEKAIPTRGSP